jgi:hypothetical protein
MKKKKQQDKKEQPKKMHPSGIAWERWNWPFKTDEERALAEQWVKRQTQDEKQKAINNLGASPF